MSTYDDVELSDWNIAVAWIFVGWLVNLILKLNGIELSVRLAWSYIPVLLACITHLIWRHKQ